MIFCQYLKVNDFNSLSLENYDPLLRHYNPTNGRQELFPCLFLERLEKLKKGQKNSVGEEEARWQSRKSLILMQIPYFL